MSGPEVAPASKPPLPVTKGAKSPLAAKKDGESWVETVKTIVYALLIALVIRTFLFQPFSIPSGSMENTLLVGDYLFVEKFAYGYSRYSFPFGLPPFSGRVFGTGPERGDVVVFKMPNRDSSDYMKDFIKRVIGVPGDRVQMIKGQVYLNDKPVPKVRAEDFVATESPCPIVTELPPDGAYHVPRYRETLPSGKSYYVLDCMPDGPSDNTQVYVVPPGHYFMMGDNRDNSDDSRAEVGFVPAENVEGKAVFLFFSIDSSAQWWELWKWPWAIRYNRLLTGID
jgi:signal peptidase I